MLGRIAIVKTFVMSQFLFVSAAILVLNYVMKIIDNMITSFIWRGKKSRLSRNILYQCKDNGGLNMPNIGSMISVGNIKWFRRYIYERCNIPFLTELCDKNGINLSMLALANYDLKRLFNVHNIPPF